MPYRTTGRGWGLKTLEPIKKGRFVIEYVGELIDDEEYQRRITRMHQQKDENYYFLTIDKDRMLDAGPKGICDSRIITRDINFFFILRQRGKVHEPLMPT